MHLPMNDFGRVHEVIEIESPMDRRVKLHINDADTMYWIEFHEESDPTYIDAMLRTAGRKGYVEDRDEDPTDMRELMEDGIWRLYLVTAEWRYDIPTPRGGDKTMPDLSLTAYGPMSGFMEAVG